MNKDNLPLLKDIRPLDCLYRNNLMKSKSMDFEGLDDHEIFRRYFQLGIDTKRELNFTQNFRETNLTKAN